jgi:Skp family chaperone for outer membrane proteins
MAAAGVALVLSARAQGVAVVDMEELVRVHPNTASDKKLLDSTVKDFRAENEELTQKLEGMRDEFDKLRKEAQDPALSDKARKDAEERAGKSLETLKAADRAAREKMQSRQEQLSDMQSRMLKKTVQELRDLIGKYAAEQKITVVLPAGQVVYSDKALDITAAVLKQLNVAPAAEKVEAVVPVVEKGAAGKSEAAKPAAGKDAALTAPEKVK